MASAALPTFSVALMLGMPLGMQDMPGIPMAGGWTLSPIWTPICGGSWLGSAADFLVMWSVMTVAMMAPSLVPTLRRAACSPRNAFSVAFAYFAVWLATGVAIFLAGAAFSTAVLGDADLSRSVPRLTGLVVLGAALFQRSPFKARQLARCHALDDLTPLVAGLRLGWRCVLSCTGVTALLLVAGIMDPRAMVLAAVAITAERLSPVGSLFARATGTAASIVGLTMIALPA